MLRLLGRIANFMAESLPVMLIITLLLVLFVLLPGFGGAVAGCYWAEDYKCLPELEVKGAALLGALLHVFLLFVVACFIWG